MFRRCIVLTVLVIAQLYLQTEACELPKPITRADNIPITHLDNVNDDYITGYVQALVDMNYYEFQVRVIAIRGHVYVFNLPCNELISKSILCFIYDIPCVECVSRIRCSPDEFISALMQCDEALACEIACSPAYLSMCTPRECKIRGIWFPQNTLLFAPLIADPRQVTNAAALRFHDHPIGKHVGAVSFGDDFIIFRWKNAVCTHGDMDFGIEAGIFSVFDLDHPSACLVNTDFFVGLLITYAIDEWSFRFRLWHLSSHIGDEFLLSNPEFERCNLSDEGVDIVASYQWNTALRLYAGFGGIFSSDESFSEKPFYMIAGTEIRVFGCRDRFNRLYVQPFLAMHFWFWQEHDFDVDQTYALGVEWSKIQGIGRKFRIFGEYHNGFSREGQFANHRTNYVAIKTSFGF